MRSHTLSRPRLLVLFTFAVLSGAAVAVLPALAAAPSEAKLEVSENCVEAAWPCWTMEGSASRPQPTRSLTIASGGTVTFIDHGREANIAWIGTPPTCESPVPVSPAPPKTGWEGKCKFEQPGAYKFESSTLWPEYTKYEITVEGAATGTTPTATSSPGGDGTTTSPPSPAGGGLGSASAPGSPLVGSASDAVKLARTEHGASVRGSVDVSQAGVGGQLEVDLLASRASLAKAGRSEQVRVGRLVRSSLKAGSVSFSVPLSAKGKAAVRRHQHLVLTAKITLTPLHGAAVTVARVVVIHA
jgi:hypothetical protein